ncbi:MAG: helix-turn-helix domain-containing protein [Holophaga sp.]|nr:helix-turn-helix domain-containing protein [Holophaga sp.]
MEPSSQQTCNPPADGDLARLERLMAHVREAPGRFRSVAAMAGAAGLAGPGLERLFLTHAHLEASAFLREARVRAACRMLPGSGAEAVGAACGFAGPEAFLAQFQAATGLSPMDYEALGRADPPAGFTLTLPEGYRVEDMLAYHGRDPLSLSERVEGATLVKALAVEGRGVVLEMAFQGGLVRCRVLWPADAGDLLGQVHRRAVRMLGLGLDPAGFERFVAGTPLQPLAALRPGLRIPLTADVWESLVWAILGQQVNLAFAYSLRRQLTGLCGGTTGCGLRVHPTAVQVAALDPADLKPLQFSRSKAEYVVGLARKVAEGALPLEALAEGAATTAALRLAAERGVGPWTTHYVMMRGCGFGDCVPLGDAGLTLALQRHHQLDHRPAARETAALMAPYAPHRSLATFHLWASLKGVPA